MKQNELNDLSQLSAKEFSNEPAEIQNGSSESNELHEETVEVSDTQLFREYMKSGKADADMEQYEQEIIPTHKKPNGNMADLLPTELSRPQKKDSKKAEPAPKEEESVEEEDFEKIMNRPGFYFDEESGTLNF